MQMLIIILTGLLLIKIFSYIWFLLKLKIIANNTNSVKLSKTKIYNKKRPDKSDLFLLEHRIGFEPTTPFQIRICNPPHSTILPPVHILEREMRLELTTFTLARWRSTNWAIPALNLFKQFGRPQRIRTLTKAFGEPYAAITLVTCNCLI